MLIQFRLLRQRLLIPGLHCQLFPKGRLEQTIRNFCILFPLFCVIGCAGSLSNDLDLNRDLDIKRNTVETSLEVSVDQQDISHGGSPEQALLAEAESQGMDAIFEKWLNSGFIFQIRDCPGEEDTEYTFIHTEGQFSADFDQVAGNYSFGFRLRSDFQACRHLSGRILRLDEEKTMTAHYQSVLLRLQGGLLNNQQPYFLIAEQESVRDISILRLIGGGKVQDALGRLARGKILKVRKEIQAGDRIFLVPVRLEPITASEKVPEQAPGPEHTPVPDLDEVIVQPKEELEEKTLPLEPK